MECIVCGNPVPTHTGRGRPRKTCSPACGRKNTNHQVKTHNRERSKAVREERICAACGSQFLSKSSHNIYCPNRECKKEGLIRAVERQRKRREEMKRIKDSIHKE